jgi:hypothetical protein
MLEKTTDRILKYIKLGPGRLGTWMATPQPPPPLVRLLYTVVTQDGEADLGGGGVIF